MRRRLARRTLSFFMMYPLSLAVPAGAAPAQEEPATPPAQRGSASQEAGPGPQAAGLTLEDCLKAALESNLDIKVRRYDPLRSETLVTFQHSVFDPRLTGSATSSKFTEPRTSSFFRSDKSHEYVAAYEDPLISGGSYRIEVKASDEQPVTVLSPAGTPEFNTQWTLAYTQPLLRNLGLRSNRWLIVTARNNLGVSESKFRQAVLDTLAAAEKAYWDLNFALMDLRTKRASLQLAKDFLEQNRIKVRVGTLAPIEITQAEAGVADREEGVILAENAVRTAEDSLRQIMNIPQDSPLWSQPIQPSDAPPLVEVTPEMAQAVAAAQANRPDLEQARLDLKNKETELYYRRNQRRWGLDFQGAYANKGFDADAVAPGSYRGSIEDLREGDKEDWRVSLNLSVPVGNRLAIANYVNAEHALNQSRYSFQSLEQAARVEVRNAVRTVETNLKRVKAAQVNVRLQREKLAAEQKKFENGMSTSFQVLQFQTDLTTAESRENQAIVDYNKSLVDLERAKGTLLEAKNMVLPGTTPAPRGATGPPATGEPSAELRFPPPPDRVMLPQEFVFDGRRLVGRVAAP